MDSAAEITVRIRLADLVEARRIARRIGVTYQEVIAGWIAERADLSRKR